MAGSLTRRQFLKATAAVGGGLSLEFSFPYANAAAPDELYEVNAWVVVHPNNRVFVRIARSEMGQGTMTALAQLVAEELDCNWYRLRAEFASPNENLRRGHVWGSMATGGSRGVRASQDYVRRGGAAARAMLIAAAAQRWGVPAAECYTDKSLIFHRRSGRRVSYGTVAAAAAKLDPPQDVKLRDPKDWKIIGQSMLRLDVPDKVLGKPVFAVDVDLPDMLHASIAQCPVFGGKLKHVDSAAAEAMRGVKKIVRQDDFVAVIADSWWRADQAVKKLVIDWDPGAYSGASNETIERMLRQGLADPSLPRARDLGNVEAALGSAAKVIEAEYGSPYLNHATMEPQTCTAWLKPGGSLEVWTATQDPERSMAVAARTAGLPLERVEVHKTMLGGGFGRRGATQDFVRQGVLIARAMPGTPVKMMWSREEDMQHGMYRPASIVKLKAGLDAQGRPVALHSRIACPSILALVHPEGLKNGIDFSAVRSFADAPYTIANQRVDYAMRNGHVPVGFWRAPGQQNAYYRESFIDELALAAGKDPLEYRLALLKPGDKNRAVLQAVAKAASWGAALPDGVHRGLAMADGFGSFTAMVAEVTVSPQGELKVRRIVVAIDSGYVVNPENCRMQAESNVVFGLSAMLHQENNIKDGRVVESNFHDFPLLSMREMPKVETVLAPTGGFWGGHGEPAILPLAPAVCNAIFAATGKRVRTLPLKHHDLRRA